MLVGEVPERDPPPITEETAPHELTVGAKPYAASRAASVTGVFMLPWMAIWGPGPGRW